MSSVYKIQQREGPPFRIMLCSNRAGMSGLYCHEVSCLGAGPRRPQCCPASCGNLQLAHLCSLCWFSDRRHDVETSSAKPRCWNSASGEKSMAHPGRCSLQGSLLGSLALPRLLCRMGCGNSETGLLFRNLVLVTVVGVRLLNCGNSSSNS